MNEVVGLQNEKPDFSFGAPSKTAKSCECTSSYKTSGFKIAILCRNVKF